jgi:phospholipid/cholesterol/gamma-HCH transport system permease protein
VRQLFNLIEFVCKVSSFGARIIIDGLRTPFEGSQILTQIAEVGYKSLPLVAPAGFALGTVMTFHTGSTLVTFGASAMIPTVQALAFFVEIGPLVAGLLLAGRVGSGRGDLPPSGRRERVYKLFTVTAGILLGHA